MVQASVQSAPMALADIVFTISALRAAYAAGLPPRAVIAEVLRRIAAAEDPAIFLHLVPEERLMAEAEALGAHDPARPLWGIPFAVKDNIDVAGCPTTAACPAYAYEATEDAEVVARLRRAGAIPVGKTNLDQFATGLVGVRSPYGVPRNALDPAVVPGGSSSGSAVAVARGLVPFALGTDTAGSGRVPAALNNIVGLKPTLGALSGRGAVPACRTLDTISVFALTVGDAFEALAAAAGHDPVDPYSRPVPVAPPGPVPPGLRVGIPRGEGLRFFGDVAQAQSFGDACNRLAKEGAVLVPIDLAPFHAVAELLYAGPWVAERHTVIGPLLSRQPEAVLPVIRQIVGQAERFSAADAFEGLYRLQALKRDVAPVLALVDLICVPSIPCFAKLDDLARDPIGPNSRLGTYTNFVNLLDLCGLAVPIPARADGRPGSVTLLAPRGRDALLAGLGMRIEQWGERSLGATGRPRPPAVIPTAQAGPEEMEIAVCGAHMSGLALNGELTQPGGRFLREGTTTANYRLYRLPGGPPFRPGLVRVAAGGAAIHVEVWALPRARVGAFLAGIPAPLGLGTVTLADGSAPKGFLCEGAAVEGAEDVSRFGNWRLVMQEGAG